MHDPHRSDFLPRQLRAGIRAWLFLTVLCTLLFSACGGGGRSAAEPQQLPETLDLLFDHEAADGTRQLMRWRFDGSPPESLPGGERGMRPQPRPDGRSLVFTSQGVTPQDATQLQLLENLTPPARRLSRDADVIEREIVYAPDGVRVAFVSQRDEPGGADVFVAELVDGELQNLRNLTPGPGDRIVIDVTPAWSPDGSRIAFTSYRANGAAALWTMAADGTDARQVTEVPPTGDIADFFPAWSPDGSLLAFQRSNRGQLRIGLVPAAGGAPALFDFEGKAYQPAWSPDGRLLVFAGDADGELDLYVRTADGASAPMRLRLPGADRNPVWIRR